MITRKPKYMENEKWYKWDANLDFHILTEEAPLEVYESFYEDLQGFYDNGDVTDEEYQGIIEYTENLKKQKQQQKI